VQSKKNRFFLYFFCFAEQELSCTFAKLSNRHCGNAIVFSAKRMAKSAIHDSKSAIRDSKRLIHDSKRIV